MLDIRWIRQNPDAAERLLKMRQSDASIDNLLKQDEERRNLLQMTEEKKALRNNVSKRMGLAKKKGTSAEEISRLTEEMRSVSEEIAGIDSRISALDEQIEQTLLALPNLPHASVPVGCDADEPLRCWNTPRHFLWEPKSYFDISSDLGIIDWTSAAKMSGAHSAIYRHSGAKLQRSLIQFALNTLVDLGFEEVGTPCTANQTSMINSGFIAEEYACKTESGDYLIPSAGVAMLNLYQDTILNENQLPLPLCACSAAFRKGNAQLIQQNQSYLVDFFEITKPEQSYEEMEKLVAATEAILQQLALPYRVVTRCTANTLFYASKTTVVEVWLPTQNRYITVAAISNCEEFQARRAGIRFRTTPKEKPHYAHTLTGNCLNISTAIAAILENYQKDDGSVCVPAVLVPYMGTELIR